MANAKKVLLVTTFKDAVANGLTKSLQDLKMARKEMRAAGYDLDVVCIDDASTDSTYDTLRESVKSYSGTVKLIKHYTALGRGSCFIGGLREALSPLGKSELDETIVLMADLAAKAPHDPHLFLEHVKLLEGNEGGVVVGSTLYEDSRTLDDVEMRQMGYLQWCSLGATGDSFHIQNPAYQIGIAKHFMRALRNYDIYTSNWPSYTDEEWPGPGVPGVMLNMLVIAGAILNGVTLPVYGEWKPSREWNILQKHAKATMLHLEVAKWMLEDEVFNKDD